MPAKAIQERSIPCLGGISFAGVAEPQLFFNSTFTVLSMCLYFCTHFYQTSFLKYKTTGFRQGKDA